MYVLPYPRKPIRWSTRVGPVPHQLPPWRRPTRHPNRPVRGIEAAATFATPVVVAVICAVPAVVSR